MRRGAKGKRSAAAIEEPAQIEDDSAEEFDQPEEASDGGDMADMLKQTDLSEAVQFDAGDEFDHVHKADEARAMKMKTYPGDEVEVEYSEEMAAIFQKVPPGEGDEAGAVKPWLGAIKCPSKMEKKKISTKKPSEDFAMEFCYGYRTEETRMNLYWNNKEQLVYPAAAVGIIYDWESKTQ